MAGTDLRSFLLDWLEWSQRHVLESLRATDPGFVRSQPAASAPSVAFHAWHLARWADRNQAALARWVADAAIGAGHERSRERPEIWEARGLSSAWGFDGIALGDYGGIGAGLDDGASAALPLPDVPELAAYAESAFDALASAVGVLTPEQVELEVIDLYDDRSTIAEVIASIISHTDRHLGMMEAIRGVLGERGTTTV